MTKTEIKQAAQDALMTQMMNAFYALTDRGASDEVIEEAFFQVRRIEKFLGYTEGSWKV